MKKFLMGSVALIALGGAANAADLPARAYTKAPIAPPVSNWTGFYLSGGFGYGLWDSSSRLSFTGFASQDLHSGGRGYFGTVGGGYDYQIAPSWVVGVFGDAQFGDISGNFADPLTFSSARSKNDVSYAAGVRLGYLIAPDVLSYVNVGYSHAHFKNGAYASNQTGALTGVVLPNSNRDGWFIGGGVENSLNFFGINAPGWFMKTDYRVADYGRKTVDNVDVTGALVGTSLSSKVYEQTISTSLVYRFGSQVSSASSAGYRGYTKASAPGVNWTGFHVGAGGGYGLWNADSRTVNAATGTPTFPGPESKPSGNGYFGTVSGGYDWQITPTWVVGIFGDAQFGDIKGNVADFDSGLLTTMKNDLNYAVGARVGYLVAPNVLSYVNAGYSHAQIKGASSYSRIDGLPGPLGTRKTGFDGWFVGGGVENDLNFFGISAPGWFMNTEYRVAEYDRKNILNYDLTTGADTGAALSTKMYVQTVSTSLVYRFNWGSPVVAKY